MNYAFNLRIILANMKKGYKTDMPLSVVDLGGRFPGVEPAAGRGDPCFWPVFCSFRLLFSIIFSALPGRWAFAFHRHYLYATRWIPMEHR